MSKSDTFAEFGVSTLLCDRGRWCLRLIEGGHSPNWASVITHDCPNEERPMFLIPDNITCKPCEFCGCIAPLDLMQQWALHNFDKHAIMGKVGF